METIADTIVKLAYVLAFCYFWRQWIAYLTARLTHLGADPVAGIPAGANPDQNAGRA